MSISAINSYYLPDGSVYYAACSSVDFKYVYIAHQYGIVLSHDYGNTWITTTIGGNWRDICCSSNGKYVYAVMNGIYIHRSDNYGITFTETCKDALRDWYGCCCSADGRIVFACVRGGSIFRSYNYGFASSINGNTGKWNVVSTSDRNYTQLCCNDSGSSVAVAVNNGNLYYTTISVSTGIVLIPSAWDVLDSNIKYWRGIRCNSDRTKIIASIDVASSTTANNGLYKYEYNGSTWTVTQLGTSTIPAGEYIALGLSRDFKNMITADYTTGTNPKNWYYSTDYGATWSSQYYASSNWHAAYICGNKFIIGGYNANKAWIGQFANDTYPYTIFNNSQLITNPVNTFGDNTGKIVQYPVNKEQPWHQYKFTEGTDGSTAAPASTGLDGGGADFNFERKTTNASGGGLTFVTNPGYGSNITSNNTPICYYINNTNTYSNNSVSNQYYLQRSLEYLSSFSFSVWMRPKVVYSASSKISLINVSNSSTTGRIDIYIDASLSKVAMVLNNDFAGTSGYKIYNDTTLVADTWYHIAGTYNACTGFMHLYVNGVDGTLGNYGSGFRPLEYNFLIVGMRYGQNASGKTDADKAYHGYMAHLNIFSTELSFAEVNYLYNVPNANYSAESGISEYYLNTFPLVKGQYAMGDSIYSYIQLNNFYILTLNNIQYVPDDIKYVPYYTVYSSSAVPLVSVDTDITHTLLANTIYIFVIVIAGGGGGGGGNGGRQFDGGGGGGGGAGGGAAWFYMAVDNIQNRQLTVRYGSGGSGGLTDKPSGYGDGDNVVFVGGNGLDGNSSYVKATVNGTFTTLCQCNGGAKAFNKYNNTYGWSPARPPYTTNDNDVTYTNTSPAYKVNEGTLEVYGIPKTDTSTTPTSNGGTMNGGKSNPGGNGGQNGIGYGGTTNTSGTITSTTVTATGQSSYASAVVINGSTLQGSNGSNGTDASDNVSAPGGSGGGSGISTGISIGGQQVVNNLSDVKFFNKLNGSLICDGVTLRAYGKGGNGGRGEKKVNSTEEYQPGSSGNNGAVFIFEY